MINLERRQELNTDFNTVETNVFRRHRLTEINNRLHTGKIDPEFTKTEKAALVAEKLSLQAGFVTLESGETGRISKNLRHRPLKHRSR